MEFEILGSDDGIAEFQGWKRKSAQGYVNMEVMGNDRQRKSEKVWNMVLSDIEAPEV